MSAVTVEQTPSAQVAPRRIPLSRITRVELRKMFDTRSGFWLMTSIVAVAVIATAAVILFARHQELTYSTFATAIGFPMAVILPMIAILSVTGEWSQRVGLTTFTLVPHRGRVIFAKAICAVAVGVASMALAFAVGALGNLVGTAIAGTPRVWDLNAAEVLLIVLGNVLGLMTGFMLGVLIRSSAGAIVAYFIYSLILPTISGALAASQQWYLNARPWVDVNYAQSWLFMSNGSLATAQWEHLGVTTLAWLIVPLVVGLWLVMRSEVK